MSDQIRTGIHRMKTALLKCYVVCSMFISLLGGYTQIIQSKNMKILLGIAEPNQVRYRHDAYKRSCSVLLHFTE